MQQMHTYVSLIRGINVGGKNIIPMAGLLKIYADLKFTNSQTYLQSGNVIFQSGCSDAKSIESLLTEHIKIRFGCEVPVLVLEFSELKHIVTMNPFVSDQSKDIAALYVTFLSDKPKGTSSEKLYQNQSSGEEFSITDKAVYLYCPMGYGKTKLNNSFIEKQLKVTATTRNWNTTLHLYHIMEGMHDKQQKD
jgi:uncharacterized protein (DUF1697 family)